MDRRSRTRPYIRVDFAVLVFALVLLGADPAAAQGKFMAVEWDGLVTLIDPNTAQRTLLGASGFDGLNSLAMCPEGVIYTIGNFQAVEQPIRLISLDPLTGLGTAVTTITTPGYDTSIRGLACSDEGTLYAIQDGGFDMEQDPPWPELSDQLFSIDRITGAGTHIGSVSIRGAQSLSFGPDGNLYAWDLHDGLLGNTRGLVQIDPLDATTFDVNTDLPYDDPDMQSLATGPSGVLYGADANGLYSIDLDDGDAHYIDGAGSIGDVRGLTWLPAEVPALGPFGLALLCLVLGWTPRFALRR